MGPVAMREECKHFQSRTYSSGEVARMCELDLAPEAPWRCPDECPAFERRLADAAKGDANNQLWAIEAIQDYNPEPDLDKIKAKVMLINDAEDHANPPELGTVERAMKHVKHGRYVLIPAGPNTHGHFSHFYAELWKPYLIEFMKTLGPPLAAAAD